MGLCHTHASRLPLPPLPRAQVQYLYALLGQRSCSGLRGGLAALRAEYEQAFKYTGKV